MSEIISTTQSHLKQLIPEARDISIKLQRDHDHFISMIQIFAPGTVILARKKAKTSWGALDSSYHAIIKQIDRFKAKRKAKWKLKKWKNLTEEPPDPVVS